MRLTGVTANLMLGSVPIKGAHKWTLDFAAEVLDATGFGSAGAWHEYAPNPMTQATLNVEGNWDTSDAGLYSQGGANPAIMAGDTITFQCYVDTYCSYTGTIIVDKFAPDAERLGLVKWTMSGKSTGPVTFPVSTSGG